MTTTSHVRQIAGLTESPVPLQEARERDIFRLLDPPLVSTSPPYPPFYRDTQLFKIGASVMPAGATDTTFEYLVSSGDVDNPDWVDVLEGLGVIPAFKTTNEWFLVPFVDIARGVTRRALNVVTIGTGMKGLIVEGFYT